MRVRLTIDVQFNPSIEDVKPSIDLPRCHTLVRHQYIQIPMGRPRLITNEADSRGSYIWNPLPEVIDSGE